MFLPALQVKIPPLALAHIYSIVIEDFAGVRSARSDCRKRLKAKAQRASTSSDHSTPRAETQPGDFQVGDFGPFPPPTIPFLLGDLILLRPAKGRADKMGLVKLALFSIMLARYLPESEATWARVLENEGIDWSQRVEASLKAKGDEDSSLDATGQALMLVLRSVDSRSRHS